MELRHLRYFTAVAEELNFRKASERLRVAQPALSSQIKDLEHELGVTLLDRDTGGVRLTDAGAAFLGEARLILTHARQAAVVAQDAAKGKRGRLTIGYFAPIFMGLMPGSLKVFRGKYPEVEVNLVEIPILDQMSALEEGTIQIGFIVARSAPLPRSLKNVEVARSPVRVVMGRSHPLARRKRIGLDDLAREQLLCFGIRKGVVSVHGEVMGQFFAGRGLDLPTLQQVDGVEAFRATLESGLGVSLVAESGSLSQGRELVQRPLKESGPDLEIALLAIWRDGHDSRLTANFISVIQALAPRGSPPKTGTKRK
jgi:DNA-binding transcriptional LysR family regulator